MINDTTMLAPDTSFAEQATDEQIKRTVRALEANGMNVLVAENGDEARRMFFELVQIRQIRRRAAEALCHGSRDAGPRDP